MSHTPSSNVVDGQSLNSLDDAEKGLCDSTLEVTAPGFVYVDPKKSLLAASPSVCVSPVHQGITPCTSVPELSLAAAGEKATGAETKAAVKETVAEKPQKPKISRWVLFTLWFNTYRKFFTFVTLLNLAGIICAACNRFPYAENHLGALVLGNLLCAVLMRNELWMRFLYMVAIYGLSVSVYLFLLPVCPSLICLNSGHRYRSS
jgi:hypothetical protein